jgi:hypothetical protein
VPADSPRGRREQDTSRAGDVPAQGRCNVEALARVAYGLICYAVFFATYLYAVGFIGNLFVPRTIDGPPAGSFVPGAVVDLVLLLAFAGACADAHAFHSRPGRRDVLGCRRASRAAQ